MADVLTVDDIAACLKVHPATIYRLLRRRALPGFRVGNNWRVLRIDLELWLEQITVMGRPTPTRHYSR